MRRLKNINQWPPNGWQYEELSTGFRFKASSLQALAEKVLLHREVNGLGREDRVEEDIQEQIKYPLKSEIAELIRSLLFPFNHAPIIQDSG